MQTLFCGFLNNDFSVLVLYKLYHPSKVVEYCVLVGLKVVIFCHMWSWVNLIHHNIISLGSLYQKNNYFKTKLLQEDLQLYLHIQYTVKQY